MNLVSRLAAAVCASGNHIKFNIAKHSDTVISHNSFKIWLWFKTHSTKTARYFCLIFRQRMQENIAFQRNLVIYLAAADCASGFAKTSILVSILVRAYITIKTQTTWMYCKSPFSKTALSASKILYHIIVDNISFQMNLVLLLLVLCVVLMLVVLVGAGVIWWWDVMWYDMT